ncbi:MAG: hypothetical protein EA367_18595 [Leptolyngbya sp. DLM2.Bin15]|nr:MAG: hypothetical protein EA367_18595 [Leptolyngbya sp. DLM2.Bin15]
MVSFLALLPRTLTTFLFALAALLRFYGNTNTTFLHLTTLRWSLLAFSLGAAALLVNLGLEWNAGNRSRNQQTEAREREARRDDLADEERRKADRERGRADRERNQADRERERAARQARIQNRWIVLQVQHHLAPQENTRAALADFIAFLQEYGE